MRKPLPDQSVDQIFRMARTHKHWRALAVTEQLLREAYALASLGPTSANCCPARFVFVVSRQAKEALRPALRPANVEKTMSAPVTVIIGHDLRFYEHLPRLYPVNPNVRSWYEGKPALIEETAFRNGTLQGAYLMIAARALGLDCGPMSGFDAAMVEALYWPEGNVKANFICNIGYGDDSALHPRAPRFSFEEVCRIV
ncbi:MAG TPA: malonic semialdehyde reductase [Steroidobacteraceae bacterium]